MGSRDPVCFGAFELDRRAGFRAREGIFRRALDGTPRRLVLDRKDVVPEDWSPNGRFILFVQCRAACNQIWALPLPSATDAVLLSESSGSVDEPRLSPDGRWLAFASNETGRWEVYLQPFPGPGVRRRVSSHGGSQPRWRRDSRELVYLALDGTLTAVTVRPEGPRASPTELFKLSLEVNPVADQYAMTHDAERFLVIVPEAVETQRLDVLTNWQAPSDRRHRVLDERHEAPPQGLRGAPGLPSEWCCPSGKSNPPSPPSFVI